MFNRIAHFFQPDRKPTDPLPEQLHIPFELEEGHDFNFATGPTNVAGTQFWRCRMTFRWGRAATFRRTDTFAGMGGSWGKLMGPWYVEVVILLEPREPNPSELEWTPLIGRRAAPFVEPEATKAALPDGTG